MTDRHTNQPTRTDLTAHREATLQINSTIYSVLFAQFLRAKTVTYISGVLMMASTLIHTEVKKHFMCPASSTDYFARPSVCPLQHNNMVLAIKGIFSKQ